MKVREWAPIAIVAIAAGVSLYYIMTGVPTRRGIMALAVTSICLGMVTEQVIAKLWPKSNGDRTDDLG